MWLIRRQGPRPFLSSATLMQSNRKPVNKCGCCDFAGAMASKNFYFLQIKPEGVQCSVYSLDRHCHGCSLVVGVLHVNKSCWRSFLSRRHHPTIYLKKNICDRLPSFQGTGSRCNNLQRGIKPLAGSSGFRKERKSFCCLRVCLMCWENMSLLRHPSTEEVLGSRDQSTLWLVL